MANISKQLNPLNTYNCRINPRPSYNGRGLKESVELFKGKIMLLTCMWLMDEDDKYPGEYALLPTSEEDIKLFYHADMTWIASGDIEVLGEYHG